MTSLDLSDTELLPGSLALPALLLDHVDVVSTISVFVAIFTVSRARAAHAHTALPVMYPKNSLLRWHYAQCFRVPIMLVLVLV